MRNRPRAIKSTSQCLKSHGSVLITCGNNIKMAHLNLFPFVFNFWEIRNCCGITNIYLCSSVCIVVVVGGGGASPPLFWGGWVGGEEGGYPFVPRQSERDLPPPLPPYVHGERRPARRRWAEQSRGRLIEMAAAARRRTPPPPPHAAERGGGRRGSDARTQET